MKRKSVLIAIILATAISATAIEAKAHTTVSFNIFFDSLAPYGNWISVPTYGYVWMPRGVPRGWRPYTHGRWVWSDFYGWIWLSYEPWGWAPYHYGRWVFMPPYGWVWIPGTVWAPSWVTWYTGPDYIGWAPLPPDDQFFIEIGIRPFGFSYRTDPSHVVFVPSHRFLDPDVGRAVIPEPQGVAVFRNTKNVTNIKVVDKRVINYGVGLRQVEEATRTRVRKVNVIERDVDTRALMKGGGEVNKFEGGNLYIYSPRVVKRVDETPKVYKREEEFGGQKAVPPSHIEERRRMGIPQEESWGHRFKGRSAPAEQPQEMLPIVEPPRIRKEVESKRTPSQEGIRRVSPYGWEGSSRTQVAPEQPPVFEGQEKPQTKGGVRYEPTLREVRSPSYTGRQRTWDGATRVRPNDQNSETRLKEVWNMQEGRRTHFKSPATPYGRDGN